MPPPAPVVPIVTRAVIPMDALALAQANNEPVYCVCRQVSYGDMVACDNASVRPRRGYCRWRTRARAYS